MSNLEKLNDIFCEVFSVEASSLGGDFNNTTIEFSDFGKAGKQPLNTGVLTLK